MSDIRGLTPNEILGHAKAREYTILGITPSQFMMEHGGDLFDYELLKENFKKICKDFDKDLTMDEKSRAVQFCSKMIYTVGPESRSVKQKMGDKTWIFKFPYEESDNLIVKVAFVCTFKNEGAKYDLGLNNDNRMVLSVRHASLLAIETMNRITDICVKSNPPTVMLTPLCGAIFSRNDIYKMSEELRMSTKDVVRMLNTSCQSGGHYLHESQLSVAALASIVATAKLGAKGKHDERIQIITKVIKQYLNHKKDHNAQMFAILSRYATGGVPTDLEPGKLIKMYAANKEIGKTSKLGAIAASRLTRLDVDGSRLAGSMDDDEDEDDDEASAYRKHAEKEMSRIQRAEAREEEILRNAKADSLVLQMEPTSDGSKYFSYNLNSIRLLDDFKKRNGLPESMDYKYVAEIYEAGQADNQDYQQAKQRRRLVENSIRKEILQRLEDDDANMEVEGEDNYSPEVASEDEAEFDPETQVHAKGSHDPSETGSIYEQPDVPMPSTSGKRTMSADGHHRKKRLSESDNQDSRDSVTDEQVQPHKVTSAPTVTIPTEPTPAESKQAKNRAQASKVNEIFGENGVKLLITSHGELSKTVKECQFEMAKLEKQLLSKDNSPSMKNSIQAQINDLEVRMNQGTELIGSRNRLIQEVERVLNITPSEVTTLIINLRAIEKDKRNIDK